MPRAVPTVNGQRESSCLNSDERQLNFLSTERKKKKEEEEELPTYTLHGFK